MRAQHIVVYEDLLWLILKSLRYSGNLLSLADDSWVFLFCSVTRAQNVNQFGPMYAARFSQVLWLWMKISFTYKHSGQLWFSVGSCDTWADSDTSGKSGNHVTWIWAPVWARYFGYLGNLAWNGDTVAWCFMAGLVAGRSLLCGVINSMAEGGGRGRVGRYSATADSAKGTWLLQSKLMAICSRHRWKERISFQSITMWWWNDKMVEKAW